MAITITFLLMRSCRECYFRHCFYYSAASLGLPHLAPSTQILFRLHALACPNAGKFKQLSPDRLDKCSAFHLDRLLIQSVHWMYLFYSLCSTARIVLAYCPRREEEECWAC